MDKEFWRITFVIILILVICVTFSLAQLIGWALEHV